MGVRRPPLVGREGILGQLRAAVSDGGFTVLRGDHGSGRTAVLTELASGLLDAGETVLRIGLTGARAESWDEFGVGPLLGSLSEVSCPQAATLANQIRREYSPESYASPADRARLLNDMARMFAHMADEERGVVVIDNAELLADITTSAAAVAAGGYPVVVALPPIPVRHAHRLLDLPPLSEDEAAALLGRLCGGSPSFRLRHTVSRALGPLAGNPGALTGVVSRLREEGRLVTFHGRVHLADREPVRLPADHRLVRAATDMGAVAVDLLLLADNPAGVALADVPRLAAAAGCGTGRLGATLDALTGQGLLTVSGGRAEVLCTAVAAAVAAGRASRQRALHQAAAEAMIAAYRRGEPFDDNRFAEHVAGAGLTARLPVKWSQRLLAAAEREVRHDPERAIRWLWPLRTLLPAGPERDRAHELLLLLAVRSGDYHRLGEAVREAATRPSFPVPPHLWGRLAVAAALSAMHTGVPVPAATRAALAAEPMAAGVIGLSDRWLAGDSPRVAEFRREFTRLVTSGPATMASGAEPKERQRHGWWTESTLRRMLDARLPAPVLATVLGGDYCPADSGFAADHGRLLTGYVDGVWDDALDAAHEVFARAGGDPRAREIIALHAAEMSMWRYGERRAGAWLDLVAPEPAYPQLAAWVRAGGALRGNRYEQALEIASAPAVTADDSAGQLALRAAIAAVLHGVDRLPAGIRTRTRERAAAACGDETSADADAIVAALLTADVPGARAAAERVKSRRSSPYLPWAYLAVGLADREDGTWLSEAYDAADARGAVRMRTWIRRIMSVRGLRPAPRTDLTDGLSAREAKIIDQVRQGRTNRQIASLLALSEKTVESNLAALFRRTGARSRQQLVTLTALSAAVSHSPGVDPAGRLLG